MIKIITALFLGIGLAMDVCAISLSNGLNEPKMSLKKNLFASFMFGFFQGLMPLIGYLFGTTIFDKIKWIIPYVALFILSFIGIKMLVEAFKNNPIQSNSLLSFKVLLIQGITTSLDAFSVGFAISDYSLIEAFITSLIIALITFAISIVAIYLGKLLGNKLGKKSQILGGIILIIIGIEIFISDLFL